MNGDMQQNVEMRLGGAIREDMLGLPPQPQGLVLFAHGSGSRRYWDDLAGRRYVHAVLRD
ncbi:hypothetical protein [Guyparkeria sp.]|uniref:hypothetical protein n=1 Tax=Guyparkeria sp. TaxID=2035736 RepID=UPI0039708348